VAGHGRRYLPRNLDYCGAVLIRSHDTGLTLPSAPEFGPDGAWPPLATDWVPLRWELFEADPFDFGTLAAYALLKPSGPYPLHLRTEFHLNHPILSEDALREDFLYHAWFAQYPGKLEVELRRSKRGRIERMQVSELPEDRKFRKLTLRTMGTVEVAFYKTGRIDLLDVDHELRRLVHSVRWRRKDPVTQLPPGSTQEVTDSVTTGLSVEHSWTLADSLGVNLGAKAAGIQAKLSSQLQEQFGLTLEITAQEQRSTKLTVTNPTADQSRLFALWHVDHRVTVDALTIFSNDKEIRPERTLMRLENIRPAWAPRGSLEFATESNPHITFAAAHSA
jgi:hypothetical protein